MLLTFVAGLSLDRVKGVILCLIGIVLAPMSFYLVDTSSPCLSKILVGRQLSRITKPPLVEQKSSTCFSIQLH